MGLSNFLALITSQGRKNFGLRAQPVFLANSFVSPTQTRFSRKPVCLANQSELVGMVRGANYLGMVCDANGFVGRSRFAAQTRRGKNRAKTFFYQHVVLWLHMYRACDGICVEPCMVHGCIRWMVIHGKS